MKIKGRFGECYTDAPGACVLIRSFGSQTPNALVPLPIIVLSTLHSVASGGRLTLVPRSRNGITFHLSRFELT